MRDAVRQLAERSGWPSIHDVLVRVQHDFPDERYALTRLAEKFSAFCKPGMSAPERLKALTKAAVELTTQDAPGWEYIAGRW